MRGFDPTPLALNQLNTTCFPLQENLLYNNMDSFVRQPKPKVVFECRNPEHTAIHSVTVSYGVMRFCADESCRLVIKSKRRKRRFKFCTFCQKYGHTHRDCFAKRRASKTYKRTYLQCRKCDKFGHKHYEGPHHHQIRSCFS